MRNIAHRREISVLVGIVAGFATPIALLAGTGAESDTIFGAAMFFAITTVALTPLLLSGSKTRSSIPQWNC